MKKYLSYLSVFVLVGTVAIFLGQHSIEFFTNTFSAENSSMGVLGYMLTGGGFFLWLMIFLWNSKTKLEKTTAFVMMVVSLLGELGTAIFNMYMHTVADAGIQLTEADVKGIYLLIGVLAVAHSLSLMIKFAGEEVIKAFQDDDGDGIPNIIDRKNNHQQNQPRPQQPQQRPAYAANTEKTVLANEENPTPRQ